MVGVLHTLVGVRKLVFCVAAAPAFACFQSGSIAMSQRLLILSGRLYRILEVETPLVHRFRQELMQKLLSLCVLLMRSSVPLPNEY